MTAWNWNRNQGFWAGIGIGMESVDFLLESESEPESDFSEWVSVTTLRESSVLYDFDMMNILRYNMMNIVNSKITRFSVGKYSASHRKFVKCCYSSHKVVTLTHCVLNFPGIGTGIGIKMYLELCITGGTISLELTV